MNIDLRNLTLKLLLCAVCSIVFPSCSLLQECSPDRATSLGIEDARRSDSRKAGLVSARSCSDKSQYSALSFKADYERAFQSELKRLCSKNNISQKAASDAEERELGRLESKSYANCPKLENQSAQSIYDSVFLGKYCTTTNGIIAGEADAKDGVSKSKGLANFSRCPQKYQDAIARAYSESYSAALLQLEVVATREALLAARNSREVSCSQSADCASSAYHCVDGQCVMTAYECFGSNYHGSYAKGGGCGYHGCWLPGGGCGYHGCWEEGGGCNYHGCWSRGGRCEYSGCSRKSDGKSFKCKNTGAGN